MNEEAGGRLAEAVRGIRSHSVENLARLAEEAVANLTARGCRVFVAAEAGEALDFVAQVAADKKNVVLSRVPAGEEIGLTRFLTEQGARLAHCHAGEWLLTALGLAGGHPYRPTLGLSQLHDPAVLAQVAARQDLAGFLPGPSEAAAIVDALRQKNTGACLAADLGITGAQAIAVDTGTIFLAEEEGDARLVSNLPHTHLVVAGLECLVPDLPAALATVRYLSRYAYGRPLVRYVSAISGPSRTGDIEMQLVPGMHGPKKVAVLLLAGGRLSVPERWARALYCLHCGACIPAGAVVPQPGPGDPAPWPYPGTAGAVLRHLFATRPAPLVAADSFTGCPLGIDMPGLWAEMAG
ncbi:MAG TPA: LUD domain-containing protein [Spirochaetia bacterium]|nr:LUD domain-containing protein [Spirochaetia bacterium]